MRISDKIEMIDGTMAHSFSIESGKSLFLVDTGMKGSGKKILSYYRQLGREPDAILITHYHTDHIGGLDLLMSELGSEVYVPAKELDIISGKSGYPEGTPAFLKLFTRIPKISSPGKLRDATSMDHPGVEAVETHGHTPGSTSYLFREAGAICVGDALYNKRGSLEVNRMFSLDLETAAKSREKILGMKPVMVLPGHGNPIRI